MYNSIPIKIAAGYFCVTEINKLISKFIQKCRGPGVFKTILTKSKVGRLPTNRSYRNQDSVVLSKYGHKSQWNRIVRFRNAFCIYVDFLSKDHGNSLEESLIAL